MKKPIYQTIDTEQILSSVLGAAKTNSKPKRVDVEGLQKKTKEKVYVRGPYKKKEKKQIVPGKIKEADLTGDFAFNVIEAPNKPKSRINVVTDEFDFIPLPVGRCAIVDKTRIAVPNAEEFSELVADVKDIANEELREKRRLIREKRAAAQEEAQRLVEEEENLLKQARREERQKTKLRRVIKTDKLAELDELEQEIIDDSTPEQLAQSILENSAGENSRSAAKKLRRQEEEDDDPFSALKVSNVPALTVDVNTAKALESMFGERSSSIMELLDTDNSDGALSLIMKTLLKTLVDVLPVIERYVRSSGGTKGVYQFTQLTAQLRETCAEIQAYRDRANIGSKIVDRYIRPSFLDIAVQITSTWVELEASARSRMSPEDFETYRADTLMPMKRGIAEYLKKQYEDVSAQVVQNLN